MATLSDVALRAGVSVSAVSRVLSNAPEARVSPQTRDRIRTAARELNYRPNFAGRALKFSRTDVIALVAPDLTNAFLTELMLGVEEEAARRGYMLLLGRSEDLKPGGEMVSRLVGEGRVDGMLVQVGDTSRLEDLQELVDADLPVVFINSVEAGHASGVVLDDERGAGMATQHLIDLGHRDIGLLGGLPHTWTARRRRAGFSATMRAAGLPVPRSRVTTLGYTPQQGRDALRRVMSRPAAPTALVVANVNAAIGALAEARRLGLDVPGDVSVVAVHDAWTAENTWPPLTAVKMPMNELGQAAVRALYNRLHALPVEDHVVSEPAPQLMLRSSTRPFTGP